MSEPQATPCPRPRSHRRLRGFVLGARPLLGAVLLALVVGLGTAVSQPPDHALPAGLFVARINYDTFADLRHLSNLDIWENNTSAQFIRVGMDADTYYRLKADGWQIAVDATATQRLNETAGDNPFANGYRTVSQLYTELRAIEAAHPRLTELVAYGASYCKLQGGCVTLGGDAQPGFDLLALRVTNEAVVGSSVVNETAVSRGIKPIFFLVANIHAREIGTPEIALRFVNWLLAGYGRDATATWLIDWHEIWIVPTANPDGHWLVELGTQPPYDSRAFYQRKNANNDGDRDGLPDCFEWPPDDGYQYGVDLNRNHSFEWGTPSGSSTAPCAPVFRGAGPASEPEVAALQDLVRALIPDQRGPLPADAAPSDATGLLISLHSYSDLVMWPWSYAYTPAPNGAQLEAIGQKLATFNGYMSCQPSLCLYEASGTTDDWAYGELGAAAFTFEIGDYEDGFMPPLDTTDMQHWPENHPALLYAASIARTPYTTVFGPDVVEITISSAVEPGLLEIGAMLDGRAHSSPAIAAALTLDAPFWANGQAPMVMQVVPVGLDEYVAKATAVLDPATLPPGRHMLFVHAQSANGSWGPIGAAFVTIDPPTAGKAYLPRIN